MSIDLDTLYDLMIKRLGQLRRERTEHEEILAFYAKVVELQWEAQKETQVVTVDLPEDRMQLKVQEGFALIEREDIAVDRDGSEKLFLALCRLSKEENPILAAAGEKLLMAADAGGLDIPRLTAAVLQNDIEGIEDLAQELGVALPILMALGKLSIQPSLFAVAATTSQLGTLDEWRHGYCPICGALPAMAALVDEEGKRQALCSFCGHIWQIPRVGCPLCDTTGHEDLRYFYGEGEELYRVQVCDKCHGYLKIVDTRKGGVVEAMAVDDVATGHLDLLAEHEGYQRKAPRLWGI